MNLFYPVILAVGVLDMLFDLAYGAYLPSLVDTDDLVEANSKRSASYAAAEVGGVCSRRMVGANPDGSACNSG